MTRFGEQKFGYREKRTILTHVVALRQFLAVPTQQKVRRSLLFTGCNSTLLDLKSSLKKPHSITRNSLHEGYGKLSSSACTNTVD